MPELYQMPVIADYAEARFSVADYLASIRLVSFPREVNITESSCRLPDVISHAGLMSICRLGRLDEPPAG